jgi:hypothetical protein
MRRALASLFLLCLSACGSELGESEAMFRVADRSGSLQVALVANDASGAQYRLRKATFEVSGNAMLTLSSRDRDQLHAPLPEGDYQMFLRPGYELVERAADGSERVISAQLHTPNPLHLHVAAHTDGSVALSFRAEHGEISFGRARGLRAQRAHSGEAVLAASLGR